MDREVIIYIVFAIIYFVVRILRKKQSPPPPAQRGAERTDYDDEQDTSPQGQPMSFEDLLRELAGEKKEQPQAAKPAPKPTSTFEFPSDGTNYEDVHDEWEDKELATLKEGHSTRIFADEESKRIYQEAIHIESAKDDQLDEQLKKAKGRFAEFQIEEDNSSAFREELVDMLSTQDGAKKAIVLSEILNRKY